jgi:hypothetical protein
MRIYLAAGSSEIETAEAYAASLRARGHTITHDWMDNVRKVGEANPRDAPIDLKAEWVRLNLDGLNRAKLVWFLLPVKPSFGLAFELGVAHGIEGSTLSMGAVDRRLVVSGDWRATIQTAVAHSRFDTHEEAFKYITGET